MLGTRSKRNSSKASPVVTSISLYMMIVIALTILTTLLNFSEKFKLVETPKLTTLKWQAVICIFAPLILAFCCQSKFIQKFYSDRDKRFSKVCDNLPSLSQQLLSEHNEGNLFFGQIRET